MHRRETNRAGGGIVKYRQQAQLFTMPPFVGSLRARFNGAFGGWAPPTTSVEKTVDDDHRTLVGPACPASLSDVQHPVAGRITHSSTSSPSSMT